MKCVTEKSAMEGKLPNLNAEKELIWLWCTFVGQKKALIQWAIQCLIVLNNRYHYCAMLTHKVITLCDILHRMQ